MYKLVLALALSSAAAFTPSSQRGARVAPAKASTFGNAPNDPLNGWVADSSAFAYGLPGSLDPVPAFDPFDFVSGKSVDEIKMLREAEVTHGRVAMLATVGFIAQERAHFLFVEPDKDIGPAIRHLDEVRAVNPAFFELLTFTIGCCELYRALNGWIAPTSTEAGKVTLELPDGALRALRPDYYPGDVGFDPLNLKPTGADEFAEMATKELQHGRLAMLAVAGFFAQELTDGQTIVAKLSSLSG